jgi:hypothetical protein
MDFNNNNYDFDELDLALSERRQAPSRSNDGRRTVPSTRRGSLVPTGTIATTAGAGNSGAAYRKRNSPHELNLFTYGLKELTRGILLKAGESRVSYHEYAVFSPPEADPDGETRSPSIMSGGEEGLRMFRDAVSIGHGLDNEVSSSILCVSCEKTDWS